MVFNRANKKNQWFHIHFFFSRFVYQLVLLLLLGYITFSHISVSVSGQIVHLETKLKTAEEEFHRVCKNRKKELSISRQRDCEAEESAQESAREEKDEFRRKIELLKVEVDLLHLFIAFTL